MTYHKRQLHAIEWHPALGICVAAHAVCVDVLAATHDGSTAMPMVKKRAMTWSLGPPRVGVTRGSQGKRGEVGGGTGNLVNGQ